MYLPEESLVADTYEALEAKYKNERNKPMPSEIHSLIQFDLSLALGKYRKNFNFHTEFKYRLT